MSAVARVGQDKTGNIIIGPGAPSVFVDGKIVAVTGDKVVPYGTGCKSAPKLGPGSNTVFAEGKPVCRQGDKDICGIPIAPGSNTVNAG